MQPLAILVLLNEISELFRVTSDIVMRYFVHGHGWNCKIIRYYLEHAFQINIGIDSFVIFYGWTKQLDENLITIDLENSFN